MQITPLGDNALMLELGDTIDERTHKRVQESWRALAAAPLPGVSELVPAYTTVTVFYDPTAVVQAGAPWDGIVDWLGARVRERLKNPPKMEKSKPRTVEIPVCYGGEFGPDLETVAKHAKLSAEEVIKRHAKVDYLVYVVGFSPGFPYLGGLPKELATPRLTKPRTSVPVGSVGIGGLQTGIYPLATPGGWNLIGRTPVKLFRPTENPPVLLQAGDRVKFRAITAPEFATLEGRA
ncbi:5-oxoprolinase subunit PxpB [Oleiharenicola lentus]|uniref:5-oxoprolinase subunit PxpB n=1 Tax=Oleiharenicola lentus TaxID=2508720 RepID=UPI003F6618E4